MNYCRNPEGKKNFLVVDSKVHIKDIEEQFHDLTARKDISMILITQAGLAFFLNDKGGTIHAVLEAEGFWLQNVVDIPGKKFQ